MKMVYGKYMEKEEKSESCNFRFLDKTGLILICTIQLKMHTFFKVHLLFSPDSSKIIRNLNCTLYLHSFFQSQRKNKSLKKDENVSILTLCNSNIIEITKNCTSEKNEAMQTILNTSNEDET